MHRSLSFQPTKWFALLSARTPPELAGTLHEAKLPGYSSSSQLCIFWRAWLPRSSLFACCACSLRSLSFHLCTASLSAAATFSDMRPLPVLRYEVTASKGGASGSAATKKAVRAIRVALSNSKSRPLQSSVAGRSVQHITEYNVHL
jgi:hypothetical protein